MNILYFFIILNCLKLSSCCDNLENLTCDKVISYIKSCLHTRLETPILIFNDNSKDGDRESELVEYYNKIKFTNTCEDMAGMKTVIEIVPYIINYRVKDFYTNLIDDRFIYAGDNNDNGPIKSVKLISEKLCDDFAELCHKFLNISESDIQIDDTQLEASEEKPLKILHCGDSLVYNNDYQVIRSDMMNCEQTLKGHIHEIGAIMTSKPFKIDTETTIPIAFYDCFTDYDPDVTPFAYSAWKLCYGLEYAYMKLLDSMLWRRVAILSDYSTFHEEFQERLIKLFEENNIIYGVEKCTGGEDLKRTMQKLADCDARIIILNTDKVITEAVFEEASALNMLDSDHVWITKNFIWKSHIPKPLIFNISTLTSEYRTINLKEFHMSTKSPRSADILRETARDLLDVTTNMKLEIAVDGPEGTRSTVTILYGKPLSSEMQFNANILDMKRCALKTNNFYNPCNDLELYLILAVLLVFSVALLVISSFFIELDTRPSGGQRLS